MRFLPHSSSSDWRLHESQACATVLGHSPKSILRKHHIPLQRSFHNRGISFLLSASSQYSAPFFGLKQVLIVSSVFTTTNSFVEKQYLDVLPSALMNCTTSKEFLKTMERIIPWKEWITLIRPCYDKGERGNRPCLAAWVSARMRTFWETSRSWFSVGMSFCPQSVICAVLP